MDLEPIKPKTSAAFETLYPRILAVVREKFSLELSKAVPEYNRRQRELLEDSASRFGDTLKAVYSLGLFEELERETAWLISVIESRDLSRSWADLILETWANAIQGLVRPPEADELTRPLVRARALVSRPAHPASPEDGKPPDSVARYLDYAVRGQRREAAEFALSFLQGGLAPEQIADGLLLPALRRLGWSWEKNRIGASTEHRATEITRYVIYRIFDSLAVKRSLPLKAVLACVPGDQHDIGIEIMAGLLRSDGWSPVLIGRGAPHQDLLDTVADARPDVLVLSVSLISLLPAACALIADVREKAPGVRIILGGSAALAAGKLLGPQVAGIAAGLGEGLRLARSLAERHA
jgi:MerR family transcriptional regulator, light-induced transcriptional regulator